MTSVSIVTVDSYQVNPLLGLDQTFSDFRGTEIRQVPVVRIFGCTPDGKKTCLHVHGAFPYMYIPCACSEIVDSFAYQLATALDAAINLSLGLANSSQQHVYKIQRVSGIPFYGYHQNEHTFFKIYLFNPAMVKRAADLLQNGAVSNQKLQPYEAHIPFILQFMIDYNLYGMSFIHLDNVKYQRHSELNRKDNTVEENTFQVHNLQEQFVTPLPKQTTCQLELDVCVSDIINRKAITKGFDLNPGLSAIWDEERLRRSDAELELAKSQFLYSQGSKRAILHPTDNDIFQRQRLNQRLEIISQDTDNTLSLNNDTSCYPTEVGNEDCIQNASCILDDYNRSVNVNKSTQSLEVNKGIHLYSTRLSETSQFQLHKDSHDTTSFDSEDRCLVEMLVHLAEDNNKSSDAVDNDSVFGTCPLTHENEIDSDNENDDAENLNLTTSTLFSMSSWELGEEMTPRGSNSNNAPETIWHDTSRNMLKNTYQLPLPQYDGADDKSFVTSYEPSTKMLRNCVRRTKCTHDEKLVYDTIGMVVDGKFNQDKCRLLHTIRLRKRKFRNSDKRNEEQTRLLINLLSGFYRSHINGRIFAEVENFTNIIMNIHSDTLNSTKKLRWLIRQYEGDNHGNARNYLLPELNRLKKYILKSTTLLQRKETKNCFKNDKQLVQSNYCTPVISHVYFNNTLLKTSKLDHNDLDVYTVPEIEEAYRSSKYTEFINIQECNHSLVHSKEMSLRRISHKFRILQKNTFVSRLPALDGCTDNTDSESEVYETIHEHEKHMHARKSKMNCSLQHVVERRASKKRRHTYDSPQYCTPTNIVGITTEIENNLSKEFRPLEMENIAANVPINISPTTITLRDESYSSCGNHESTSVLTTNIQNNEWTNKKCKTSRNIGEENVTKLSENDESTEESTKWDINVETNEPNEICDTTFTQLINEKLCQNSATVFSGQSDACKGARVVIKIATKFNPPSYQRISESMETYNLLQCKHIQSIYSTKKNMITNRQVAGKNCIANMILFKSSLEDITNINVWRRMKVNEFHPSGANIKPAQMRRALASYKTVKVTPLIKPPLLKHVLIWLKRKKCMFGKYCERENNGSIVKDISNHDANTEKVVFGNSSDNSARTKDDQKLQLSSESLHSSLHTSCGNASTHKSIESLRPLGISYGQIDFSSKNATGCVSGTFQPGKNLTAHHYLTILSVEVHVVTRDDLLPDPKMDSIEAIFYAIENNISACPSDSKIKHGAIIVGSDDFNSKMKVLLSSNTSCPISYVRTEENLLKELITLTNQCDPDILTGWQVETLSWGYIIQRAHYLKYNNFSLSISRITSSVSGKNNSQLSDANNFNIKILGRIVLDTWRIMKHELTLLNYTFENVMFNVLRERIPCPTFKSLTNWWRHPSVTMRCRVIEHYIVRVLGTLQIMSHLDIINRSSEHAKLFGIQLYEVFSRGSQYRVESMMLRLAKPLNYVPISPSIQQRAKMRAPEVVPLIMEPESTFYTDPVIVLDFQSLYPSMIIAYNYCFSTCLGRTEHIGQTDPFEFGAATLRVTRNTALKLQDRINFAPCGVSFVKSEVRKGILPRMLEEILNTRLMVKNSMKVHPSDNRSLQRTLESQQLGLKLIANVTYGYTAANFSGRMPCVEIADSVVSKGRETLELAIKMVESTKKWGAQVVYGDTDSLFILLPGKTRKEAFTIGIEIADAVTAANPPPVKLKFEKVLHPCILQTKKRYCGYMYETPEQEKAVYLAKGIETVRRDGCPAVAKILEKTLKILFDTKDILSVKSYVTRQLDKVIRKRISIDDLTFAREFRGINGYKKNACVPALELTRRLIKKDPRAVPLQGERVRYIIVAGAPDQPLIQCVRTPWEVISNPGLSPNIVYYITKVIIPPLNRCLSLIGTDVNTWYGEMSHRSIFDKGIAGIANANQKVTICQFFNTVTCLICAQQTTNSLCSNCLSQPNETVICLHEKIRRLERSYYDINTICLSCTGQESDDFECASLDCPTLYRVKEARKYLAEILHIKNILNCVMDSKEST